MTELEFCHPKQPGTIEFQLFRKKNKIDRIGILSSQTTRDDRVPTLSKESKIDRIGILSSHLKKSLSSQKSKQTYMEKKEYHRRHLPHFQQSGQAYFVTWCIKDAVPRKALISYTVQLKDVNNKIDSAKINNADDKIIHDLKIEYFRIRKKYMKAYDDLLHLQTEFIVNLSKEENTQAIIKALCYWEGTRIENYAICVMSNHVHWVFRVLDKDENGEPIYLQDILQSVKRFSANKINKLENRTGSLWHNESYDTTIRDDLHLHNAINYTIENPVSAGLVKNWWEWKGTKLF